MRVELGFDNSLCLVAATAGICDNFRRLGLGRRFSRSAYTSTRSEGRARHTSRHLQPALLRYSLPLRETVLAHV